jgi:hypothetical protein
MGLLQLLLYLGTVVAFLAGSGVRTATWRPSVPRHCGSPAAGRSGPGSCPSSTWCAPSSADDIWRACDPALPSQPGAIWKQQRVPSPLHWWWALFLASNLLGWAALGLGLDAATPQGVRAASAVTLAGDFLDLPLTVLAFWVVAQITRRQEARSAQLAASRIRERDGAASWGP